MGGNVYQSRNLTLTIFIIMKESLEKLIRKVILKKYSWIKDLDISVNNRGSWNAFTVRYYIDDSLSDNSDKNELNVIKTETKNLYSVLGPNRNDLLEDVVFFSYKGLKMKETLEKLIKRVILPKYNWIKDFYVTGIKDGVQNLYTVHYYVDDDLYNEDDRIEINHVKSDTKNLYDSLGPSEYDFLNNLSFTSY